MILIRNAHQNDRQIAGDPQCPKRRHLTHAALQDSRGGSQRGIGIENVISKALEQICFVRDECPDAAAASAPASRRACWPARTPWHRDACRRDPSHRRAKPPPWSRTRCAPCYRAECVTRRRRLKIGSSTGPDVLDSGHPSVIAAAATNGLAPLQKTRPVGLELHVAGGLAFDDGQMGGPHLRVAGRTPPSSRQNCAKLGHEFGFHKQFAKGRMRQRRPPDAPEQVRNRR